MYWIFVILGLLLLWFNLEPIPGRPSHNHYVIIWTWHDFRLIRIIPQDWYVLIDKDVLYLYMDADSLDTYIRAIRLDTHREHHILHYRYLLDWIKQPPTIRSYPPSTNHVIDILNYVRT